MSSTGPTVSSGIRAPGLLQLELVEAGPLFRQRRALALVQRDLEHAEAEESALQPHRRERDANLLEQLVARHGGDFLGRAALDHVHEHGRRRLADRAAAALEL